MVITPRDWKAQPWRNGRGTTYEVLRVMAPPDLLYEATGIEFALRISVAEVEASGPFSTFPGYTRWSLLLDGGPIAIAGQRLEPRRLLQLDGGTEVVAEVSAPGRLLNIIARSATCGVGEREGVDIVFDLGTHACRYAPVAARDDVWISALTA